jgi:molybdopterin-guanine dinucleotide biosynthesis protein A
MNEVTGVILAGGRGQRMGGLDKGLQPFLGQRLIDHAVTRLKPQVQSLLIVANRHRDVYSELGYPVVDDASAKLAGLDGASDVTPSASPRFEGPCKTPWLASVPATARFFRPISSRACLP